MKKLNERLTALSVIWFLAVLTCSSIGGTILAWNWLADRHPRAFLVVLALTIISFLVLLEVHKAIEIEYKARKSGPVNPFGE